MLCQGVPPVRDPPGMLCPLYRTPMGCCAKVSPLYGTPLGCCAPCTGPPWDAVPRCVPCTGPPWDAVPPVQDPPGMLCQGVPPCVGRCAKVSPLYGTPGDSSHPGGLGQPPRQGAGGASQGGG